MKIWGRNRFVEGDWTRIWNAKIPHKARYFAWRAARNVLPNRENLQARGIQTSCLCVLCQLNPENNWHLFVDCPTSKEVWRESGLCDLVDSHAERVETFKDLLFGILRNCNNTVADKFLMMLWSIWYRRNDVLWSDGPKNPNTVVRRAISVHSEWLTISDLRTHVEPTDVTNCGHLWHPPPDGFIKCNTDASVIPINGKAGFGVVFRDDQGALVAARSKPIVGVPTVRECEALAIFDAISWAIDMGFTRVIFETDAKIVVDAANVSEEDISEFGDIMHRIRSMLGNQEFFSIKAVSRQANGVAHALAQLSHLNPCLVSYPSLPSQYLIFLTV